MKSPLAVVTVVAALTSYLAEYSLAQQIYDTYTTIWDRSSQFTYKNLGSSHINFASSDASDSANIVVSENDVFQSIDGFGGSLTDNAAQALVDLKAKNEGNYFDLLNKMFNATDGGPNAGLSFLRVPLAASDFSPRVYSFNDANSPDRELSNFSIDAAKNVIAIIDDIKWFNPALKIHMVAWSPPGWMKTSGTMKGGSIKDEYHTTYAHYLLKVLQAYKSKGIIPYSMSVQNEPQHSDPTYPTCKMSPDVEGAIGAALRGLMDSNGYADVKLIGFEHNWSSAGTYAVELLQKQADTFSGVAFHCYEGSVGQQGEFASAFPNKEIYMTECAGTVGSDFWTDLKWYMDNIFIGAVEHGSRTAMMWNLVADSAGNPKLPGTASCGNGCRGIVTVDGDGSFSFNQEYYAMAHASKATTAKDADGPTAKRIGTTIQGTNANSLRVTAYQTGRASPTTQPRFSLVVMNRLDSADTNFDPRDVTATIEFRGQRATYKFPVGVTTLTWYARTDDSQTRREYPQQSGSTCSLVGSRSHRRSKVLRRKRRAD